MSGGISGAVLVGGAMAAAGAAASAGSTLLTGAGGVDNSSLNLGGGGSLG